MITANAPAKIIIFGEHAVVYGKPALALPLGNLTANVTIIPDQRKFSICAENTHETLYFDASVTHPLILTVRYILEKLEQPIPNIQLKINSDIPIASGLGSGAAVSTAIIHALLKYFNVQMSLNDINTIVYEIEKLHHGTPSGIDNTVIVFNQPVFFVKNQPIEHFSIGKSLDLLIGDTGIPASTRISVGDVRKLYEADRINTQAVIDQIGDITIQAKDAIESGDINLIGQLMNINHVLLQQLTVSSEELDHLTQSAIQAGALGAKLSGGGRGGNMIALVNQSSKHAVIETLYKAGARNVISTTIPKTKASGNGNTD